MRASLGHTLPKGLLRLPNGETLIARTVRLLRAHGVETIYVVVGHGAEHYRAELGSAAVELVFNPDFAHTSTFTSLLCGLTHAPAESVFVLESDVVFGAAALSLLTDANDGNAVLISSPTHAGDEVWASADGHGALLRLSKDRETVGRVAGEFVGLSQLDASACRWLMQHAAQRDVRQLSYDAYGLVALAQVQRVGVLGIAGDDWGEVDDAAHWQRVQSLVWPRLALLDKTT